MGIGLVNHATASSAGASCTTPAIDTTGATLLVAVVATYYDGIATTTISDNKSNTWQHLTIRTGNTNNLQVHYVYNPTAGTGHTFTGAGGNGYPALFVLAYSGTLTTSSVYDKETGVVGSSKTTVQPGIITPAEANEVFVTGFGVNTQSNLTSITINLDFIIADTQPEGSSNSPEGGADAYLIYSGTSGQNPTWTVAGSDHNLNAVMAAFKSAGGPPSFSPYWAVRSNTLLGGGDV